MKKTTSLVLLLLIFGMTVISCKKNSTPATKIENPAKATINSGIVLDTTYVTPQVATYELGSKIFFSRNGSVTKLGCKMPKTGSYRVSFWDFDNKNQIASTTVNVTDISQFTYNSVSAITVTANTRYVLTVNNTSSGMITGNDTYTFAKKSNTSLNSIFPFTTGSVTYEKNLYITTPSSLFPSINDGVYFLNGVADLQFEYSE